MQAPPGARLQRAVGVGDDLDGRDLHAALGGLALEELGLGVIDVHLELLLDVIVHAQDALRGNITPGITPLSHSS